MRQSYVMRCFDSHRPRSNSRKFMVERNRKKIRRKKNISSTLVDFANNTSLLGINLTYRKRSFLWAIAYIICVTASIIQSWTVTKEFFEHKTTQNFLIRNLRILPFPSVTVCNQLVLPDGFNLSSISGFNTSTLELKKNACKSKEDERLLELLIEQNREIVVQYLRKLNIEERSRLSQPHEDFLERCLFSREPCSRSTDVREFFNPFHGTCFTYNPGYGEYKPIESDMHGQLMLILKLNKGYRLSGRKMRAGVLIHTPGTPPVLDSPGMQIVYSHQTLDISLRIAEKTFIQQRQQSRPSCVDREDQEYRQRGAYYTAETPYLYSVQACMRSCEQDMIGRTCNLINPSLPLQAPEYENKVNTSLPPLSAKCDINESIDMESCDCPLPCNITQYISTIDSAEYQYTRCNESDDDEMNRTNDGETSKVRVTVSFLSNTCERVEERFVHGWPEFLGFLGGNMSLWTGMCVLSILELLELAINLLWVCLTRAQQSDRGWAEPVNALSQPTRYNFTSNKQETAQTNYATVYT